MNKVFLNVGEDSKYKTIQSALNSIGPLDHSDYVISLAKGIYREKIRILKSGITLIGESPESTVITYDDCAKKKLPDGTKMGTFNSFTLYIGGDNFVGENLTIENSAGPGSVVGQAVALYADADRIHLKNCHISGFQDTLFTGPLPIDPIPKGINPLYPYRYINDGGNRFFRQFYESCQISGDIDFIFGSASALFSKCEIRSRYTGVAKKGFVTAGSHSVSEEWGYVFLNCTLTGEEKVDSVYLGRPWRPYSNVSFINCTMGSHIIAEGWDNWNSPDKESTARYSEVNSCGAGASLDDRAKWVDINKSETETDSLEEKWFFC